MVIDIDTSLQAGHFGRVGQPYAEEALAWLKSQVDGKIVYCELVMRDQYGRVVRIFQSLMF